jgi:hypothetical protein
MCICESNLRWQGQECPNAVFFVCFFRVHTVIVRNVIRWLGILRLMGKLQHEIAQTLGSHATFDDPACNTDKVTNSCIKLDKRAHRHTPDLATQEPSASGVGTRGALTAPRPCCGYGYCVLTWQAPALKCRLGVACGGVAEFSACAICCSIYFQVSR